MMSARRYFSAAVLLPALALSACHKPYYIQQHRQQLYVIDKNVQQDSATLQLLKPYKRGVDTQMQVVIGRTDIPLTKAQPESLLGDFMADAQLEAAQRIDHKVVASVMNYGGIRLSYINPGEITRGKMYELMPFDNMLAIVEVPGDVLKQFCDAIAAKKGWPVSGLQFTIKDKHAENITVDGQPLNEHIVYKIALNDYVARGGDNCDFLVPLKKKFTTIFLRDVLIDYVAALNAQNKPLHPQMSNRIRYAE
ncbi:5'-nucleotidase C-terminal domain-containing protein [Chitinophagaceae bacterium MMS25-I14]